MIRAVVVQLWTGAVVVHRLGSTPVATLSDSQVLHELLSLGIDTVPPDAQQRRDRLSEWPTQADLDAIATAWTAANDGVRPRARVLEETALPSRSGAAGGFVP